MGMGVAVFFFCKQETAYEISSFTYAMFGIACVLAAAPARAAATMATSSLAAAMRTDDMAEMGDGLRRMPGSTIAVLGSGPAIAADPALATSYAAGAR